MKEIIEILREEHRNADQLLSVVEQELRVFDRTERPDYEILQATIAYLEDFPEHCHHPKELVLFDKLKTRDPVAAAKIRELDVEHKNNAKRLRRFAQVLQSILTDHEVRRQTFHDVACDFVEHARQTMRVEEQILFPAALKALRAEDWVQIDARVKDKKDPLFNGIAEQKFHSLREYVLEWTANEAGRA